MSVMHALLRAAMRALVITVATTLPAGAQRRAAPPPPPPLPQALSDGQYDVVLLTHASAAGLDERELMTQWFAACRKQHQVPAADSVTVVRSRPWDWNAPAVKDPRALTFLVSRSLRTLEGCDASAAATVVAYARGYRFSADTAYPYDAAIASASLRRADSLVPSLDVERIATTRLTRKGLITVATGLLRISVPIDAVAPDSSGTAHDVEIEVVAPDATVPHRMVIPWSMLRPLWEQVLEARTRGVLAEDAAAAVADVVSLRSGTGSAADRLAAQVRVADAFAQAGDLPAARIVLGRAVQEEPCLTLGAAMPAPTRAILTHLERPRDRCRAQLPLTLARATLLPGLGQLDTRNRRIVGGVLFATVTGTLAGSQATNAQAKDLYAQYRAVDDPIAVQAAAEAADLYDRAESKRLAGRTMVMVGVGLWAATIVESAVAEQRLIRRLRRVQEYSNARRVGVAPVAGPSRVGLAISFF